MDHGYFTANSKREGTQKGQPTCLPYPQHSSCFFDTAHEGVWRISDSFSQQAYCRAYSWSLCALKTIRMYTRVNWLEGEAAPGWNTIQFNRLKRNENVIMTHSVSPRCHCLQNPDPFNVMVWDSECRAASNICCSLDPVSTAKGQSGYVYTNVDKAFKLRKTSIQSVWLWKWLDVVLEMVIMKHFWKLQLKSHWFKSVMHPQNTMLKHFSTILAFLSRQQNMIWKQTDMKTLVWVESFPNVNSLFNFFP